MGLGEWRRHQPRKGAPQSEDGDRCLAPKGLRGGRHAHHLGETAPNAPQRRPGRAGRAGPKAGSSSALQPCSDTRPPEVLGGPAPRRNSGLLGNRRWRSGRAPRSQEQDPRSAHLLPRQPPIPPASLLSASPCVAESLPLAPPTRFRFPRHLSAHLPQSQAPPKAKRSDIRRDFHVDRPHLPGYGHLHLHLHQPAPGLALPAPPLPGQPDATVSEQSSPCVHSTCLPARGAGPGPFALAEAVCADFPSPHTADKNVFPKESPVVWRNEAGRGTGGLLS